MNHRPFRACLCLALWIAGCETPAPSDAGDGGGTDSGRMDSGPDANLDASGIDAPLADGGPMDVTDVPATEDAPSDARVDAPLAVDAGPAGCGPVASRPTVIVSADIASDTTWTCDNIYEIDQIRYVNAASGVATLTIEPGTIIRGEPAVYTVPGDSTSPIVELPGALVVTRNGRLVAEGTASAPIVFTSAAPEGSRAPGDWGGLVLLGRGENNFAAGEARLEGLPLSAGPRGVHGALPGEADPAWSCGSLRYLRVEFAGFVLADARELNGITLGSCGTDTRLSHVQVHIGLDDGVEFFGGAADVDHLVITGAQDDSVDWDNGFRGRLQFVAVQQYPGGGLNTDSNGMEADNDATGSALLPQSEPRFFNVTLIGTGNGTGLAGIRFRRNTLGFVANAIVTGFPEGAVDVDDALTIASAMSLSGLDRLVFRNSIAEQSVLSPPSGAFWTSDSDGLVESTHFTGAGLGNRETTTGTPPTVLRNPFDRGEPGWVPAAGSAAATGAATPGEAPDTSCEPGCSGGLVCRFGTCRDAFYDAAATYVGAFAPGDAVTNDWTRGWITTAPN